MSGPARRMPELLSIVAELTAQLEQYRENLAHNLPRIVAENPRSTASIARVAYWESAPRTAERRLQRQLAGAAVSTGDAIALATVLGVDPSAFYAPIDAPG